MKSIVLFKNNLRYNDNPVLYYGSHNNSIIPVYIYDNVNTSKKLGSASRYWLHHALSSLNKSLNNNLLFYKGNTSSILLDLINNHSISKVYCEEPFLAHDILLFSSIKKKLNSLNVELIYYNCNLLWKPYSILKDDKSPYKVFSPFYKKGCLQSFLPNPPIGVPKSINYLDIDNKTNINQLELLNQYKWYTKLDGLWNISEKSALDIFNNFLKNSINNYKKGRDFPAINKNSRLSPYIRFGMISVNRIWNDLNKLEPNENIEHFKSEIGWREFSYYLLYHFPHMETKNLQCKFDKFDWDNSSTNFNLWKRGQTGYPIVDAGMRELWQTGFMHNRLRMIVASFLVKNLLIDWRLGESWFWDCLVDADYASNIAGWQWTAGTGADAAPYFRIFNPILQGQKFDPNGIYTKKYIPELENISIKNLYEPWKSDMKFNYPNPMIDYRYSRERSLEKYSLIK